MDYQPAVECVFAFSLNPGGSASAFVFDWMPGSVAPYRKRKRYVYKKKRPPPSRWDTYWGAGKQLAKDVMYLKTLINSEPHRKFVQDQNNFNYNGLVVSLCTVATGDNADQRTGQRVLPRFLNVNGYVVAGENNTVVRVMLFRYWGEASSDTTPAVNPGEVLRTVGTTYAALSHLNEDNVGARGDRQRRIEVHKSELYCIDQLERREVVFNWDVEVNGMGTDRKEHVEWPGSATTEPISGGFYLLFISNSAVNSAMGIESKFVFYDT